MDAYFLGPARGVPAMNARVLLIAGWGIATGVCLASLAFSLTLRFWPGALTGGACLAYSLWRSYTHLTGVSASPAPGGNK